jgi:hypothetical protein
MKSIFIIYTKLLEKLDFPAFLSILRLPVFIANLAYLSLQK